MRAHAQPHSSDGGDGADGGLRPLLGLVLAGYGVLVLAGVLPHDSAFAGTVSLAAGLAVLAAGLPAIGPPRRGVVAGLGCACVGGVAGQAWALRNGIGTADLVVVAYGLLLMAASFQLQRPVGRTDVGTLVAWSLPLALTPLALFALHGLPMTAGGSVAPPPVVEATVVAPTVAALHWLGTPVEQVGSTLHVATPTGPLGLDVGLVCAGLYPAVLVGGLVALHAWRSGMDTFRMALAVFNSVAGLWLLNALRLVVLVRIGIQWGTDAMEAIHANLAWLLVGGFMVVFWGLALRRPGSSPSTPPALTYTE